MHQLKGQVTKRGCGVNSTDSRNCLHDSESKRSEVAMMLLLMLVFGKKGTGRSCLGQLADDDSH
jgi:hypothetical protein